MKHFEPLNRKEKTMEIAILIYNATVLCVAFAILSLLTND